MRPLIAAMLLLLGACTVASGRPPPAVASVATPRPAPPAAVSALVGDGPEMVLAVLGPPVLRRADGSAEVWLYATPDGCRIDLVLYREGNGVKVAHADARTPRSMSETACLQTIAAQAPS